MVRSNNSRWQSSPVTALFLCASLLAARAESNHAFKQVNLVSDQSGNATFVDANLINPWGILVGPDGHLIVADNHSGMATFYKGQGHPLSLAINIPAPGGGAAAPTGLGWNSSERSFVVSEGHDHGESVLLFVTEDGTIAGWNPDVDAANAIIAVDNSAAGAIYKGMDLVSTSHGPRLFAANFGQGAVETYDRKFQLVKSFTDTNLASAGYVPFNIRQVGEHLFVTYAFKAAPDDGDETAGPGLGYVDEFNLEGKLVRQFAAQGTLNAPWGLAVAPNHFGPFSNALLVGNFGDGRINAYNLRTGAFLGQLEDSHGDAIAIEGLWGLAFNPDSDGAELYFTAGPNDENDGLLGLLRPERH